MVEDASAQVQAEIDTLTQAISRAQTVVEESVAQQRWNERHMMRSERLIANKALQEEVDREQSDVDASEKSYMYPPLLI